MRLKKGVNLNGVKPETVIGMQIVNAYYMYKIGRPLFVTAVCNGKHCAGSLHYVGLAFDSRTRDPITEEQWFDDLKDVKRELKTWLNEQWDIVIHTDHLHFEFQPK